MLVLNEQEILSAVSLDDVMHAVEKAYATYVSENFFMPHRVHIDNDKKTLLYMPCMTEHAIGTKYLTLFPENIAKGLPTIYGLMVLNDVDSGRPLCVLDGKFITALRTGAVGGLGIRHTSKDTAKSVGLIGAGVQGYYQLLYACHVRPIEDIYIFDSFSPNLDTFIEKIQTIAPKARIHACQNVTALLQQAEIIITATTSCEPVLPNDVTLLKGKSYIGIGSYKPHMREFPPAICEAAEHIFIDIDLAKEETGDMAKPLDEGILQEENIGSFGHFLLQEKNKEQVKENTSWFKSVGMALFDVTISHIIYEKALEKNIGFKANM